MNKQELVAAMAKEAKTTQSAAEDALDAFMKVVEREVGKGGDIKLIGWGKFERKARSARQGRNPKTGEVIEIAAKVVPICKLTFDVPQKKVKAKK